MTPLEKECDALWRKAVKKRDGYKCRVPKCGRAGEAHHIFPRSYANTRYDEANGLTLCRQEHHCHDRPGQLSANVRACISYEEYDKLFEKSKVLKTWHEWELKELKIKLKEML